ncbi:hypothetical protein [Rickettsia endosymbiont of Aspidapion aeneum]|uniref:hypothetical protein n=1 Tax=Rickettsia endosymbiont of Aspidapion aeneum TaxID=3066247 RepID=UPI00313B6432
MIKSRHDTAFFQRSYSSGLDHAIQKKNLIKGWMPWSSRLCCMALKKCPMSFPRRRESRKYKKVILNLFQELLFKRC